MKNRITYKNKTYIQVELLKRRSKLNIHNSDRIRVTFYSKAEKDNPTVFYIHALEAIDFIQLLSATVAEAIIKKLPLFSTD
jgi:hypothetical protein